MRIMLYNVLTGVRNNSIQWLTNAVLFLPKKLWTIHKETLNKNFIVLVKNESAHCNEMLLKKVK